MVCSRVNFTFTFYLHSNTSRYFRNKKKEYLKVEIDEHETKNKIKNQTCTEASMLLRRVISL